MMEVWRLKLINVVHEKVIREIFVDVRMKMKSVGIDEGCDGAEDSDPGEESNTPSRADFFQGIFKSSVSQAQPGACRADPLNCEQDEPDQKAAVQIHPEQHG